MNDLFEEWKERPIHEGKLFITDGIMNKEKWEKSNVKILFLLKEAYDSDPDKIKGWDLPSLISKKGISAKMWKSMSQWAYGLNKIHETGVIQPFVEKGSELANYLFSSAVVNIKKSSGKSNSNTKNLASYLESDWDLIEKQIHKIDPDIVVCGNTWNLINKKLDNIERISDMIYKADGNRVYIDVYHPANQYSYKLNYYYLCALACQSKIFK